MRKRHCARRPSRRCAASVGCLPARAWRSKPLASPRAPTTYNLADAQPPRCAALKETHD
ncbi:hypothetical protein BLAT2472_50298 [Burkholderia latens]